uniref:Uncharacterized protein n=1 Tax=Arundo donax TaxID=35708 RepID=A0A0A9A2R1_ARUDO
MWPFCMAVCKVLARTSAAKSNSSGDKGSPCLRPLLLLK